MRPFEESCFKIGSEFSNLKSAHRSSDQKMPETFSLEIIIQTLTEPSHRIRLAWNWPRLEHVTLDF